MAPDNPLRSVNYLRNNPKGTPCSGHIKITNPTPVGGESVVSLSGFTEASRMPASWSMVIIFPRKRRKKTG